MTFTDSVRTCFTKYADFGGRAGRSELWWFVLFVLIGGASAGVVSDRLGIAFNLATTLPSLAVTTRRLHDTSRSGWWQLLWLVPILGWIVLCVFCTEEGRNDAGLIYPDAND
jgi:uncharacterized membrane protein YhaH (DUF805 family)